MGEIHSVDVEDDQFAYRYDTQLLIDRRDEDLDEDEIADYMTDASQELTKTLDRLIKEEVSA